MGGAINKGAPCRCAASSYALHIMQCHGDTRERMQGRGGTLGTGTYFMWTNMDRMDRSSGSDTHLISFFCIIVPQPRPKVLEFQRALFLSFVFACFLPIRRHHGCTPDSDVALPIQNLRERAPQCPGMCSQRPLCCTVPLCRRMAVLSNLRQCITHRILVFYRRIRHGDALSSVANSACGLCGMWRPVLNSGNHLDLAVQTAAHDPQGLTPRLYHQLTHTHLSTR